MNQKDADAINEEYAKAMQKEYDKHMDKEYQEYCDKEHQQEVAYIKEILVGYEQNWDGVEYYKATGRNG